MELWRLDGMARRYGQRPSALLGLAAGEWLAWQLDRATWEFGEWLDGMLAIRKRDGSPKHTLQELLITPGSKAPEQYAKLGSDKNIKRMAIPADGIW